MSSFSRKYGEETTIVFPVPKLDDTDFAATGDWTPVATDIRITKDAGTLVDCSNTASAVSGAGSLLWALTLTATEMEAAVVTLQIVDAVLEHDAITIETYGHPNAQHAFDLNTSMAQLVDDIWDEVLTGATHNIASSAGRRLRQVEAASVHASGVIATVTDGHTFTLDAGAVGTADYYVGDRLEIIEGTGAGQSRLISAYTAGKVCTLDSDFAVNPNTSSLYDVVAADVHVSLSDIVLAVGFVATYTNLTTITLDGAAVGTTDYYKDKMIVFTHGTGRGQSAQITGYTSGRVCTLSPALTVALDTTSGWHITANAGSENLGGMSATMKAQVKVEAKAVMDTDAGSEEASVPAAAAPMRAQVQWMYQALRNQLDVSSTTKKVHNNAGAVVGTKALTVVASVYSEAKMT